MPTPVLRRLRGIQGVTVRARLAGTLATAALTIAAFAMLAAFAVFAAPAAAEIQAVSGDLLDEIEAIRDDMPGRNSEGFVPPTSGELDLWRSILESLLAEDVAAVDSILTADLPEYGIFLFTDIGLDSSQYYLLKETAPVTLGWGTVILRLSPERKLAIEVPHPLYDINTPTEGGDIFRRVGGRLFIMAGTHRCANAAHSPCDGSTDACGDAYYHVSDMGHVTGTVFEAAHEVFITRYGDGYSFSLHGNTRTTCEDIFLSNGHATDSQQILFDLRDCMVGSGGITVGIAGYGSSCPLYGSTNVQGRYTNGSPDPCLQEVSSTTGRFVHAEQHRRVRDSLSVYTKFIDAIEQTIPAVQASVVPAPSSQAHIGLTAPSPNPCKPQAVFAVDVASTRSVKVEVFNLLGRRVALIYDGTVVAGRPLALEFDVSSLASELYFIRASTDGATSMQRLTVLR